MSFYVLKNVFPIALPVDLGTVKDDFTEYERQIDPVDRVNLLNRDYLVSGETPKKALINFFGSIPKERELCHGVEESNGAGLQVPLVINTWYAGIIVSANKTYMYLFIPTMLGTFIHDCREVTGGIDIPPILSGPYDELIKKRSTTQEISINTTAELDHTPSIAQLLKAAKKEWILVENN
jgi:hypothetical protein